MIYKIISINTRLSNRATQNYKYVTLTTNPINLHRRSGLATVFEFCKLGSTMQGYFPSINDTDEKRTLREIEVSEQAKMPLESELFIKN